MVKDVDLPPTRMQTADVVRAILQGRLGLQAAVAHEGREDWGPATRTKDFWGAYPTFRFPQGKKAKEQALVGTFFVGMNAERLLELYELARKDERFQARHLVAAVWSPEAGPLLIRNTQVFEPWDGFYLAPMMESHAIAPGEPVVLYFLAFNFSAAVQTRQIHLAGIPIPAAIEAQLTFTVAPSKWVLRRVAIPLAVQPGVHKIEMRSTTTGARVGKAALVGVLTLGSFVYVPGFKGFTVEFTVLEPKAVGDVNRVRASLVDSVRSLFDEKKVAGVLRKGGARVPRDFVLSRLPPYLTAERIINAYEEGHARKAESGEIFWGLFGDYLWDEYGAEGMSALVDASGAPAKGDEAPPAGASPP